jgi:O-antigen/teichoic acid export membrane protein
MILGEKIMVFVAGPEFSVSGTLLKILIFAAALIYLGALFGYGIVAADLQKKMIKFYLIDALISLPLYFILIPIYTYWAAAYLTILTELIITASAFYILRKYTHIKLLLNVVNKAFIASLAMSLVLLLLINQGLITLIIIGFITYLWALYLLKGYSKNTLLEIVNIKKQ